MTTGRTTEQNRRRGSTVGGDLETDLTKARPRYEDISWQRFSVPFEYPIAFTRAVFDPDNPLLADLLAIKEPARRHRCLVFVDDGIAEARPGLGEDIERYFAHHAERVELAAPAEAVPGGERIKGDSSYVEAVLEAIQQLGIDRHSYVLAIGGGAVLDAVGFAAATAHRGARLVRIPTTVLSQSDSGVGVKNGLNRRGVKNFVGTFAPPWAVINDLDFLDTLPSRERISGLAEAVKVALIRDGDLFDWIEANAEALTRFEPATEEEVIRRTAALHTRQIVDGGDPFECGSARPLDFGHWSAHKLEILTEHRMRHGEAVAIGMALDARYSVLAGLLEPGQDDRIVDLLERLGLSTWQAALHREAADGSLAVLTGLTDFREHLGGDLTVTLLSAVGTGIEVHEIDTGKMLDAIEWLRERAQG